MRCSFDEAIFMARKAPIPLGMQTNIPVRTAKETPEGSTTGAVATRAVIAAQQQEMQAAAFELPHAVAIVVIPVAASPTLSSVVLKSSLPNMKKNTMPAPMKATGLNEPESTQLGRNAKGDRSAIAALPIRTEFFSHRE
jgi:hypothetical protein